MSDGATNLRAWQLDDAAEVVTGFPFASADFVEETDAVRLIRGDNVVQGSLRWDGVKKWSRSKLDGLERYMLRNGDIVLAMDRPWIEAGLKFAAISSADEPCLLVQRVACLRAKRDFDQRFLKAVVSSAEFTDHILAVQTGTSVPHISASQIKSYRFFAPDLDEQRAIARILGALDDKIELNRRMNRTLEALAQKLFKSWFVDFEPVLAKSQNRKPFGLSDEIAALFPNAFEDSELGPIPKGWRVSMIGTETTLVGGSTPSTDEPAYWNDGTHCWVTPRDLSRLSDPVLLDTERKITDAGVARISSGLLPAGTVLLSSRAPIGYVAIADLPTAVNQGFIAIKCDAALPNQFVRQWVAENMDEIEARAGGTTFAEISKAAFRPIPVVVPSKELLVAFQQQAALLFDRLVQNVKQNQSLAAMRDLLLPKLLSGEIRIPMAEIVAEAAT